MNALPAPASDVFPQPLMQISGVTKRFGGLRCASTT